MSVVLLINVCITKFSNLICSFLRRLSLGRRIFIRKENLGTIAKSGTQNFLSQLSGDNKKDNMLIGQFGVGFYSAFMVADQITVTSRKAGEDKVYSWSSDGNGEYTVADVDIDFSRGTEVLLHIKEAE